jgi:hypothetical protein
MSSFAQTASGGLDISTGNLRIETSVAQCTAWKLSNLFGLFLGEWFRDTRLGVPWFRYVFVSNPQLPVIANLFRKVIMSAPGVASITSASLDYINQTRNLVAAFTIATNDGAILAGGPGDPFVISSPGAGT